MMFPEATILAPGLLGASLGKALHAAGLVRRITVWARRPETRAEAARESWCDAVADTPEEAVSCADLVVICTPVEVIHPLVEQLADSFKKDTLVTDVGSTKSLICRNCDHALRQRKSSAAFVGSHPMAGSEKTGLHHARADLFANKPCLVTPLPDTPSATVQRVVRLWQGLGMEVTTLSPEKHDEIVAHISHLPHLLATILSAQLGEREPGWRYLAGNGLADTTRIAAGSPTLWKSILQQNRDEVLRALDGFERELQETRAALANEDWFALLNALERGKAFRDKLQPLRRNKSTESTS